MCPVSTVTLRPGRRLHHIDAAQLAQKAMTSGGQLVVIDMAQVRDADTAAFARFVLLRRELLAQGRDLRLAHLRGRAANVFEVHRLQTILPMTNVPDGTVPSDEAAPVSLKRRNANRERQSCGILHRFIRAAQALLNDGLMTPACANGQGE